MLQGIAQRLRSSFAYPGQSHLRPNRRTLGYNSHLLPGYRKRMSWVQNMFLRVQMERTETKSLLSYNLCLIVA